MKNPSSNRSEFLRIDRTPSATLRAGLLLSLLALGTAACRLERPLEFPTAANSEKAPARKPDGVAVDLEGTLPTPAPRAGTDAGLITLREPVAPDAALDVVRAFFQAVRRTDMPALRQTISAEATFAPVGAAAGPPAEAQWDRRLRKFDYKALGPSSVFHESAVEIYRYADLEEVVGDRPVRPALMAPNDLLVRVPIAVTRVGVDRVFGDEMVFVLRRGDNTFRIQAIFEDFQVP